MSTLTTRPSKRLIVALVAGAALMFAFGYLLVPIYRVFCQVTGLNGTTDRITRTEAYTRRVDFSRRVVVEFTASTAGSLPWDFHPDLPSMEVIPGKLTVATFHAKNFGDVTIIGQAVPSVTPNAAATYFHKVECFCFSRQTLEPGESRAMPVQFVVDPDLPAGIGQLTLSYTFFSVPGIRAEAESHVKPAS